MNVPNHNRDFGYKTIIYLPTWLCTVCGAKVNIGSDRKLDQKLAIGPEGQKLAMDQKVTSMLVMDVEDEMFWWHFKNVSDRLGFFNNQHSISSNISVENQYSKNVTKIEIPSPTSKNCKQLQVTKITVTRNWSVASSKTKIFKGDFVIIKKGSRFSIW